MAFHWNLGFPKGWEITAGNPQDTTHLIKLTTGHSGLSAATLATHAGCTEGKDGAQRWEQGGFAGQSLEQLHKPSFALQGAQNLEKKKSVAKSREATNWLSWHLKEPGDASRASPPQTSPSTRCQTPNFRNRQLNYAHSYKVLQDHTAATPIEVAGLISAKWVLSLFSTLQGNLNWTLAYCFLLLSSNAQILSPILTGIFMDYSLQIILPWPVQKVRTIKNNNNKKKAQGWKTITTIGTTPQLINCPCTRWIARSWIYLIDWDQEITGEHSKLHLSTNTFCFQDLSR